MYIFLVGEYAPPVSRKRPLESSGQQTNSIKYFKPSTVADEFSSVVDQVTKLLQSCDPSQLVEKCKFIMGSDVYSISFFSADQLKQLKKYNNTPMLLQELSHLWSWSNHSVLRVLVGSCDKAVKLLNEFDCCLDPLEPVTSYPVSEIAPKNVTIQTTLGMKCKKDNINEFSLQNVIDMGSLVVNRCDLTHHCPQLLGIITTEGSVILNWSIPKCISHLISSKLLQHSSYFYEKGVLEFTIPPHIQIDTGKMVDLDVSFVYIQILIEIITFYILFNDPHLHQFLCITSYECESQYVLYRCA